MLLCFGTRSSPSLKPKDPKMYSPPIFYRTILPRESATVFLRVGHNWAAATTTTEKLKTSKRARTTRLENNYCVREEYCVLSQQKHLEKFATRRARGQIQVDQTGDSRDVA